jgi:MFS family permease
VAERGQVGPGAAYALIRSRGFGPYFFGNAISATGTWFQNLAAQLLVYRQTHSSFLLGVLAFSTFAPSLLLAPVAGSIADRVDRRRLIATAQGCSLVLAATLAGLTAAGLAPAVVVIAFGLALGTSAGFSIPASQALVGSLVPPEQLTSAVALNSMTYNLARAIGPALGGITVAAIGIAAAFAINALSFVALLVGVLLTRPRPVQRAAERTGALESLRLVRRDPVLLALLVIVALAGAATDPVNTLAPAYARAFGRPDTSAGFVIAAFGVGAVVAGLLWAGRGTASRRRIVVTLALLGLGVALFSVTPSLPVALVFLAIGGFGFLSSNTAATARLQLRVPESQRGRIMALWAIAFVGIRPLASLLDGAVASTFGVRAAGVVLAVPVLVTAGAMFLLDRRRRLRSARAEAAA